MVGNRAVAGTLVAALMLAAFAIPVAATDQTPIYREVGGGAVAVGTYHSKDANGGVGRYFAEVKDALDATNMAVH